jgi:hypothetical protein
MELKPIPGHPGYSAAADGRIKGPQRWLKPFPDKRGYLRFNTFHNGKWVQLGVHAAVCAAFHGVRPEGMHAAHLNGDPQDNRAENLKWCTPRENESHKREHGTAQIGSRHHSATLVESQVVDIRLALKEGAKGRDLAQQYGVSEQVISYIKRRKTWRHV